MAVQSILGSSPKEWGSGQKKMETLRESDLNPTNFDNGKKSIRENQLSHILNLILESFDCSQIYKIPMTLVLSSTESY